LISDGVIQTEPATLRISAQAFLSVYSDRGIPSVFMM
jgi:hypothetical protein